MRKVYVGLTGDKEDYSTGSQTLLELAVEDQNLSLLKKDFTCRATVVGVSITALNSFEMLFAFTNKLKKVATIYSDNLAV